MAEEQLRYPQAWLAMDNGDLIQVTDFTINTTNNAKQKHTIRRRGSGISFGVEESTITFNTIIDEDGPERDYWQAVENKQIKQIRAKIPGGRVLTYNGAYQSLGLTGPLDDATQLSPTFVGHKERG